MAGGLAPALRVGARIDVRREAGLRAGKPRAAVFFDSLTDWTLPAPPRAGAGGGGTTRPCPGGCRRLLLDFLVEATAGSVESVRCCREGYGGMSPEALFEREELLKTGEGGP